ncbi:hypothetical protein GCM10010430_50680 [Kitasatospora cystarginea]|uniref:Uncharacterized protein n=1 Tax=Kitasatospora cystarginea TaxID=58350 RepID=A0ABN3EJD5_9ACTN
MKKPTVPVLVTSLKRLVEDNPLGPVWWRYGRTGLHPLTDALDNPQDRAHYERRHAALRAEEDRRRREHLKSLACVDCGTEQEQERVWVQEARDYWTHRRGGATPATPGARPPRRVVRTGNACGPPALLMPSGCPAGPARAPWAG